MKPVTPNNSPEPLVLDGVSKRYGQGPFIIEDLDWTFAPGTVTGLVGPNGSGKTTLLRLLSVVAYPTEGTIRYGNLDIHAAPYRYLQHVGMVYAEPGLPQHLTAVELLEWIVRERGHWTAESPAHIDQVLDKVLLDERRHNLIGTYSSGMLQKTQVAAALVARPSLLLMDEPFRGLDTESRDAATGLVTAFRDAGGLVILASHAAPLVEAVCDAVITLPFSDVGSGKSLDTGHPNT